ncbi:Hypothetical predicted protein [Cloeon dipterum]|uniref:Uncharacterized protein n=1 Tax=Cloeon dipterum TaxID=197152 RepID=A0A8S1CP13_9INSE|nr:Hypothetical predicted protein [Cloeon dipterum]
MTPDGIAWEFSRLSHSLKLGASVVKDGAVPYPLSEHCVISLFRLCCGRSGSECFRRHRQLLVGASVHVQAAVCRHVRVGLRAVLAPVQIELCV